MLGRLPWVDIAKGLGIILVVIAHTRLPSQEVRWWINSFHMPLFFVVAGLCYDETRYSNLWKYLARKSRALVYPYVTLSLIVLGLFATLYVGSDSKLSVSSLFGNMLRGGTFGAFWFITVLLEVELSYAILASLVRPSLARLMLVFVVAVVGAYVIPSHLPYFFDAACVAVFFYGTGHFMRGRVLDWTQESRSWRWFAVVAGVSIALQVFLLLVFYRYKAGFASRDFKEPMFYFALALLGTAFLVSASILFDRCGRWIRLVENWIASPLQFIGRNTIVVLALHNALGAIRNSWCSPPQNLNAIVGQGVEFGLLALFMWLFSGPLHCVIAWPKFKEDK